MQSRGIAVVSSCKLTYTKAVDELYNLATAVHKRSLWCRKGHALTVDVMYYWRGKIKCGVCREAARQRWRARA